MQIEIIDVSAPYQEGKYFKVNMKYSREGKETERKLVDVGDSKEAFAVMRYAKAGEVYEIDLVKNGEFQNWVKATKLDGSAGQPPIKNHSHSTKKNDDVQNYIVRQNSVTNAVAFVTSFGAARTENSVDDVVAVAAIFENWVLRPIVPIIDSEFKDDIPY